MGGAADMPENIFLNYRRQTEAGVAGRIYDSLSRLLPQASLFMDVDRLSPGEDFEKALEKSLDTCKVFLAIIGPQWATMTDAAGHRRIEVPDDFVRREVATALAKGTRVIPVLVGNAVMPDAGSLPADLKQLAKRHAIEIRHEHFNADVGALAKAIGTRTWPGSSLRLPVIVTSLAALALVAGAYAILKRSGGAPSGLPASRQTFQDPRVLTGQRVDRCLHWGINCGDEAASYWCQTKGYKKAESYKVLLHAAPTYVQGNSKVCNDPGCTSFSEITCEK